MAEFKVAPPDAPVAEKLLTWVDNRFPASKLYKEHMSEYYAPKNFNWPSPSWMPSNWAAP